MEAQVIYYTCLNNDCAKHRNIFTEGDPQHANCKRERLYLEGQRAPLPWPAILAASAVAMTMLGLTVAILMSARGAKKRFE